MGTIPGMDNALLEYVVRPANGEDPRPPVLCFLHGYDEGAPTGLREGVTRQGPLRPGNPPIVARFLVLAPQLPMRGDLWPRYADAVLRIVDDAVRAQNADADRVYLTGFSFGGNGVFDLGLRSPATWAALWAVDPTHVPAPIDTPLFVSVGAAARPFSGRLATALRLGEAAGDFPGDHLYSDEGLDHVGCATSAYRDERIYRWLLGHRRQPARR